MYDVIVVGGGPAGLSAALWLGRYRRKTLVLDSGDYRNRWADRSHGWLGADPTHPMANLERARGDLRQYETVEVRPGKATAAAGDVDRGFQVEVDGDLVATARLVLATGVVDDFPEVDGFFEHYGAGVHHCPTCDGFEAKGCPVVVFGSCADVTGFALQLLDWAASVTVVTDGRPFEGQDRHLRALARNGIEVLENDAVELVGPRGALRGVRLDSGRVLDCQMAFFTIGHNPRVDLARSLGCELDDEGYVVVDRDGATSVEGVYAAGDLTPGYQLAPVASGEGTAAGVACALSLQGEQGAPDSPAKAPDCEVEIGSA